jgi:hypothetical protein
MHSNTHSKHIQSAPMKLIGLQKVMKSNENRNKQLYIISHDNIVQ